MWAISLSGTGVPSLYVESIRFHIMLNSLLSSPTGISPTRNPTDSEEIVYAHVSNA